MAFAKTFFVEIFTQENFFYAFTAWKVAKYGVISGQ